MTQQGSDDDHSHFCKALSPLSSRLIALFVACGSKWMTVNFYNMFWIFTRVVYLQCCLLVVTLHAKVTDVDGYDYTRELHTHSKNLHWKLTLGEKSSAASGNRTYISIVPCWLSGPMLYQLSYPAISISWAILLLTSDCSWSSPRAAQLTLRICGAGQEAMAFWSQRFM